MKVLSSSMVRRSAGVLLLMLSAAVPWAVAEEAASAIIGSSGIIFQPIGASEGSMLRVSCSDGFYFEKNYAGTDVVSFSSTDMAGQCKYELRTHPVVDREALEAAEEAGDEQRVRQLFEVARQQVRVSHGSFQVAGGVIVAPQLDANVIGGVGQ